ncbi:hypothetical protein UPYG_G00100940 [Umbra pygmaea]|uniref:Uncharacterized protein n=1 Tax=Umbra pygmaea TaxID=75934 RepID=A0ABD0X0Q2_UMBPY
MKDHRSRLSRRLGFVFIQVHSLSLLSVYRALPLTTTCVLNPEFLFRGEPDKLSVVSSSFFPLLHLSSTTEITFCLASSQKNLMDPPYPTPAIVLKDCENGNPLAGGSVSIRMDGEDMVEEDGGIDVSLAVSLLYSMFQIYNVAYPKCLRKTMAFLEAFVFKRSGPIPICVKRVYNSL